MTFIQKFANSASGLTARTEINKTIEVANGTGWGDYTDTQYTSGSPLALSANTDTCLLYTSPSPRDRTRSRMPSSA